MASPEAYDAFHDTLVPGWTATPVIFENDPVPAPDTAAPFLYVEIVGDTFDQETIGAPGANTWLESGFTYIHVMVPNKTGSRAARAYAKDVLALFREQSIAGLNMPRMSIGAGEPGRDFPKYWALTATIIWDRRDITGS